MLDTGAGLLEIFANGVDRLGAGALRHIALAVEDTDVCIEAARAEGYEITMEPTDLVIQSNPPYPARIGFCIGPVGEELEFFCEK
jgi:glyoxylase I family protein